MKDIMIVPTAKPTPILNSCIRYFKFPRPNELVNRCFEWRKYQIVITAPKICDNNVANAAPCMPQPNKIIKIASKITFVSEVVPTK